VPITPERREYLRLAKARQRAERKEKHKCPDCGQKPRKGLVTCDDCLARRQSYREVS
jgi:hypothetical protein